MTGSVENKRLAEFSRAVMESTLKRLQLVPDRSWNWRITPEAMSFADLARHIIDADNWLFRKIEEKTLEPIVGKSGLAQIGIREQYQSLLDELETTGERRASMIESLNGNQLSELLYDSRFGTEVTVWWIIVRGNLDHEIHHRGQVAAYLRAIGASGK